MAPALSEIVAGTIAQPVIGAALSSALLPYHLRTGSREVVAQETVAMYADWVARYPIAVLEDGLAEDDWAGWALLDATLGSRIELVGDDLFVTNLVHIASGIREDVANAVLIKLNQASGSES